MAGLRLELADLLVRQGQTGEAIAVLETDPTGDRQVLLRLARAAAWSCGEHERALEAYRRLLERDPQRRGGAAPGLRGAAAARDAADARGVPAHRHARRQITRADLAALLAVKVTRALAARRRAAAARSRSTSPARGRASTSSACWPATSWPSTRTTPSSRGRSCAAATWRGPSSRCWTCWAIRRPPRPSLADLTRSNLHFYPAGRVVGGRPHGPDARRAPSRPGGRSAGKKRSQVVENLVRAGRALSDRRSPRVARICC